MKHLFRKYLKVALLFSNLNACMGAETSFFSNLSTEIVEHIGEYVAGPISKDGAINLTDWNALYQTSKKNCKSLQRQEKKYIDAKAQQYTTKAFKFYRTVLNAYLYPKDEMQKEYLYLKYQDIFDTFASVPVNGENKVKKGLVFDTIKEKIKTPLEIFLLNSACIMYNRYPEIIKYPEYEYVTFFVHSINEDLKDPALCLNLFTICTDERGQTIRLKNLREIFSSESFKEINEDSFYSYQSFNQLYPKFFKHYNYQSFNELNLENPSFFPELTKKEKNIEADKIFIVNFQKILKDFKDFKSRNSMILNILKLESINKFYTGWEENWVVDYSRFDLSDISAEKEEIKNLNLENTELLEELKKYSEQGKILNKNKEIIFAIFESLEDKLRPLEKLRAENLKNELKEIGQTIEEKSWVQGVTNIMKEKYKYDLLKSKIDRVKNRKIEEIQKSIQEVSFYKMKLLIIRNELSRLTPDPVEFSNELSQMTESIEKVSQEIASLPPKVFSFIQDVYLYDKVDFTKPKYKILVEFCDDLWQKNALIQKMQAIIFQWDQYCKNNFL